MKEELIQVILEFFEWNEICNRDWEYSEKENLNRAENILEDFQNSEYIDLEKYLIDHHKNNDS